MRFLSEKFFPTLKLFHEWSNFGTSCASGVLDYSLNVERSTPPSVLPCWLLMFFQVNKKCILLNFALPTIQNRNFVLAVNPMTLMAFLVFALHQTAAFTKSFCTVSELYSILRLATKRIPVALGLLFETL